MAKYTINVPASGGTITAATRASDCVGGISIDTSGDAPGMISSTGITGNDITITLHANSTSSARSCDCPISAITSSGPCIGDSIQLIQAVNTIVTIYICNLKRNHNTIGVGNVQITTSSGTKTVTFDTTIDYNGRKQKDVDFAGYFGTVTQVKVTIGGVLTTISNSCYELLNESSWTTNASDCKTLTSGGYLSITIK